MISMDTYFSLRLYLNTFLFGIQSFGAATTSKDYMQETPVFSYWYIMPLFKKFGSNSIKSGASFF